MSTRTMVTVMAGKTVIGGALTLSGDIERLTDVTTACNGGIAIRSATDNATVYIHEENGRTRAWFLNAEDSISIPIRNPNNVFVSGTASDVVYWMAVTE